MCVCDLKYFSMFVLPNILVKTIGIKGESAIGICKQTQIRVNCETRTNIFSFIENVYYTSTENFIIKGDQNSLFERIPIAAGTNSRRC